MKYLLPALLVALVAFLGVTYGDPRVCYSCRSDSNENCTLNNVNVSRIGLKDCEFYKDAGFETVCYKVSGSSNGATYVERGCDIKKNKTGTELCSIFQEEADKLKATDFLCDICTSDFCNSSSSLWSSFAAIYMSLVILWKI